MKNSTKYRSRFCGCMRNSEKTAPQNPPILLITCESLKAMKETKYRYENYTIGIAVDDLYISKRFQSSSLTASYRLQWEVSSIK